MRELILDTETTGLNYLQDRIIEIGIIELVDRIYTYNSFHTFIKVDIEISNEIFEITGITNNILIDKPYFHEIANDFLNFIRDDTLIAHNSTFDINFINEELKRINKNTLKNPVKDTLQIARKIYPNSPNNLDALAKRLRVDLSKRKKHGALIDAEILSKVYIYLMELEIEQNSLNLFSHIEDFSEDENINISRKLLIQNPTEEELELHKNFLLKYKINLN